MDYDFQHNRLQTSALSVATASMINYSKVDVLFTSSICAYVIGFVKIDPNHTGTEIHFIGEH